MSIILVSYQFLFHRTCKIKLVIVDNIIIKQTPCQAFFWGCYGRIIYVLCVKIIGGQRMDEMGVERDVEKSHLRFQGRESLRWQRGNVIIVEGCLFLIRGWVIVRRLVLWHVRS
jgi:hypothetical protein